MKSMWLDRLGRPVCQKATQNLAMKLHSWSRNDDRRLKRLMCYLWETRDFVLTGRVMDHADDLFLVLYVYFLFFS